MVQAPPTRVRLSSTSTRFPARARYAAQARPLWPAPTITTSQRREANSRTGAGNPISPRTAAVGEITIVSIYCGAPNWEADNHHISEHDREADAPSLHADSYQHCEILRAIIGEVDGCSSAPSTIAACNNPDVATLLQEGPLFWR